MATNDDDDDGKKSEQTNQRTSQRNETKRKSIYWCYTKIQFENLQPFHLSIQSTTLTAPLSFSFPHCDIKLYCVRNAHAPIEINWKEWKQTNWTDKKKKGKKIDPIYKN